MVWNRVTLQARTVAEARCLERCNTRRILDIFFSERLTAIECIRSNGGRSAVLIVVYGRESCTIIADVVGNAGDLISEANGGQRGIVVEGRIAVVAVCRIMTM